MAIEQIANSEKRSRSIRTADQQSSRFEEAAGEGELAGSLISAR
jgi:hypothetical protein